MPAPHDSPGQERIATQPDQDAGFVDDFLARYQQLEQARLETAKAKLRAEIFPRLKQWGVAKVKAEYSGYGDSGAMQVTPRSNGCSMSSCPVASRPTTAPRVMSRSTSKLVP